MLIFPVPADGVSVEDVDAEVCLYRSDIDEVLVLNQSAADVWRLADGSLSVDELLACIASAYGKDPTELRDEVLAVIADLRQRGYLQESDRSARPSGRS